MNDDKFNISYGGKPLGSGKIEFIIGPQSEMESVKKAVAALYSGVTVTVAVAAPHVTLDRHTRRLYFPPLN